MFDPKEIVEKIITEAQETEENFIFTTVRPYCESVTELVISKKILINALLEYKRNHPEEFEKLKEKDNAGK